MTARRSDRAADDLQRAERMLAIAGFAVVSREIDAEIKRIEALRYDVPLRELEAVLYAVYSGPYGEYHRPSTSAVL
ncbi:hypothetical protein [Mesorhizobium helmanticense]|uniref:Uncharacterized protein n=1 Tax=Mesorhizobium helmanticense TaxID=1776423 RepID=A0A2T4IP50_9HYPH|nr:hypothetical protein [Mesorhizobium helmanticense]PTE07395.1 hypothetical protein C9427_27230 [Mesorhizobium helmanticense]